MYFPSPQEKSWTFFRGMDLTNRGWVNYEEYRKATSMWHQKYSRVRNISGTLCGTTGTPGYVVPRVLQGLWHHGYSRVCGTTGSPGYAVPRVLQGVAPWVLEAGSHGSAPSRIVRWRAPWNLFRVLPQLLLCSKQQWNAPPPRCDTCLQSR